MTTLNSEVSDASKAGQLEEIKVLKARYFRLIDTKDWAGLRVIFADNLTYTDDAKNLIIPSADAFLSFLSERHEHSVSVHQGFMPEIEINAGDGTATGIWAMQDIVRIPSQSTMLVQIGYGHYHETYARIDGVWLIETIHLTRLWLSVATETVVGAA